MYKIINIIRIKYEYFILWNLPHPLQHKSNLLNTQLHMWNHFNFESEELLEGVIKSFKNKNKIRKITLLNRAKTLNLNLPLNIFTRKEIYKCERIFEILENIKHSVFLSYCYNFVCFNDFFQVRKYLFSHVYI